MIVDVKIRRSKGQFFLVGAIMIVLALYMLSNTLSKSTHIDCADVQDNNHVWTIDETEKGLSQITRKNLTDRSHIDEFIGMQREIANENGYALGFDMYPFYPYDVGVFSVYTISLESNNFYILKEDQLLPYYSYCEDGLVCLIESMGVGLCEGYSKVCCKFYGFCC